MISVAAYLENEKVSDLRSEYVDGRCLPMIGGGRTHDLLCARLSRLLRPSVAEAGCRLYRASFKVRVHAADGERFYYPDLQVACDKTMEQPDYLENPRLVLEVLSPSTEQRDRDIKATDYQQIDSLLELALVSHDAERVEIRRRRDNWAGECYGPKDCFRLESIGAAAVAVADIYEVLSSKTTIQSTADLQSPGGESSLRAAG